MSDFNAVTSQDEHRGGSHYYYNHKASVFSDFIASNNLLNIDYVGPPFTWCNNQSGLARRWARLDRCLANSIWLNSFETCLVKHLPRFLSDHSPLLLMISPRVLNKKKIFRFENFWLDYLGCHSVVREAWHFKPHSNPMHAVSHLIARTRSMLLEWKSKGLDPLESDIDKLEASILEAGTKDGSSKMNDFSPLSISSV